MELETASRVSSSPRARLQSHVGGEAGARAAPVLRRPALRQRDAVVRLVPSARTRVHGRARPRPRIDGRESSAQRHDPRQRRLLGFADVGRSGSPDSREPGASPDGKRAPGRDGSQGTRGGGHLAPAIGAPVPRHVPPRVPARPFTHLALERSKAIACFERTIVSGIRPMTATSGKTTAAECRTGAARDGALLLRPTHCAKCHADSRSPVPRSSRAGRGIGTETRGQRRRRPLPRPHAAQHRRDRALHARRPIRDPRGGRRPLREGRNSGSGPDPLVRGFSVTGEETRGTSWKSCGA